VLKCLQSELDNQQKRIAELEKENQALRQKTDAISVSSAGNVGILSIRGVGSTIELGEGVSDKEVNAGKIGFRRFGDWLDIVGAGLNGTRKIHFWAEHGAFFNGNVGIATTSPHYKLDVNGTIRGHNVSPSDQRYKQNIQTLENALTKLQELRGISFEWKGQNAEVQIGLIAQEVERVFPELVSTDSEGYKSIAYGQLTAILIEAIKEQQQNIEQKSATITELQLNWQEQQKENAAQQERIALLEAMMQEIAAVALSRAQDGDATSHNAN
jgi:flagellar biosynthesis chaperone FliJ